MRFIIPSVAFALFRCVAFLPPAGDQRPACGENIVPAVTRDLSSSGGA